MWVGTEQAAEDIARVAAEVAAPVGARDEAAEAQEVAARSGAAPGARQAAQVAARDRAYRTVQGMENLRVKRIVQNPESRNQNSELRSGTT